MNVRISRSGFLSLGAAMLLSWTAGAPGAHAQGTAGSDPPEALMKKMMEAVKNHSYDDFMIECDETMRAALTKQQFEGVSSLMTASLQPGHKTTYLGKLRRKGMVTYLWKLEPPATLKEDTLIHMTVKDKKVAGFFLQ
jgi:hypothetical protein